MPVGGLWSQNENVWCVQIRPEEVESIMKQIDLDGSGQVDFDEFLQV